MKQPLTIGTVCFIQDKEQQKILLLHRAKAPMKDLWTGVGGKTDFLEDIRHSCLREVFEETGLTPSNLCLKAIVKTILEGEASSWILFVYTADSSETELNSCPEGRLEWVPIAEVPSYNLIGFIRAIFPHILNGHSIFEGTIVHDVAGRVISIESTALREPDQAFVAAN